MTEEYIYDIGKYTIGVDKRGKDEVALSIAKIENEDLYVLGSYYGENAECIDLIIKENKKLKEQLQQREDIINEITNYCKFQIEKEQDKFPKPIESEEWLKGRINAFEEILDNKGDENNGL